MTASAPCGVCLVRTIFFASQLLLVKREELKMFDVLLCGGKYQSGRRPEAELSSAVEWSGWCKVCRALLNFLLCRTLNTPTLRGRGLEN